MLLFHFAEQFFVKRSKMSRPWHGVHDPTWGGRLAAGMSGKDRACNGA